MTIRGARIEAAIRSRIISLDDLLIAWDRREGKCRACGRPFDTEPTIGETAAMEILDDLDKIDPR
jgi:hypothetical protein